MTRAKPVLEEAFLYLIVIAFFGMVTAGIAAHRHGEYCGHAASQEETR